MKQLSEALKNHYGDNLKKEVDAEIWSDNRSANGLFVPDDELVMDADSGMDAKHEFLDFQEQSGEKRLTRNDSFNSF